MTKRKKIGLALGSGSSRGWSHIGVIKALNENNIPIDYIAGTSIGAYIGAIAASGKIEEFEKIVLDMDWKKVVSLLDISVSRAGVLDGRKVLDLADRVMVAKTFKDLKIPLHVISADLKKGEEIILSKGSVRDAVRASIAIPGIFRPIELNGVLCVDGGILNPVPVNAVRNMGADVIIAVDLNRCLINRHKKRHTKKEEKRDKALSNAILDKLAGHFLTVDALVKTWFKIETGEFLKDDEKDEIPGFLDIYRKSMDIMEMQVARLTLQLNNPDIIITPDLGHIRLMDFDLGKETIAEGYNKTMEQMEKIRAITGDR
jgi:NTE family protein